MSNPLRLYKTEAELKKRMCPVRLIAGAAMHAVEGDATCIGRGCALAVPGFFTYDGVKSTQKFRCGLVSMDPVEQIDIGNWGG